MYSAFDRDEILKITMKLRFLRTPYKVKESFPNVVLLFLSLEGTARYVSLLLIPAEGFGLRQGLFLALRAKKQRFYAVFASFMAFLGFSSNLSNFK